MSKWALKLLEKDEIEIIHDKSLELLSEEGIQVDYQPILEKIKNQGVKVEGSRVFFDEEIVMESVGKSTKRYAIHARDPKKTIKFGDGIPHFQSSGGQMWIVDSLIRKRRKPTRRDLKEAIIVGDYLDTINIVGSMVIPQNLPILGRSVYLASELVRHSSKVVSIGSEDSREASYVIKLFEVLAEGEENHRRNPMISCFCAPVSPLRGFRNESLEILKIFCEKGLPVAFGPMVMAGLSGPVTLAGTLTLENAEILAGITISQILAPGTAVGYCGIPHIADMRNLNISFGSPEQAIMAVAMVQMGKSYGFSVHVNTGITDSNVPDAQSGIEKGASLLISALAGAEMFGHLGIVGADQGASLEQLIIDNEMAGYVKRVIEGFDVNEDTLALDLIKKIESGMFTGTSHTMKHMRKEQWFPDLFNRDIWESWSSKNSKDLLIKAKEMKQKILKEHKPELLDKQVENEINQIVKEALRVLT